MKKIIIPFIILFLAFPVTFAATNTSNAPINWGFKKSQNHQPPDVREYDALLEQYGGIYLGDTSKKVVYLTFDNGYENGYTAQILDTLKERKVQATFFVTGHYLDDQPELVKRMVKEGHIIGNHSWHHPDLTQISDEKLREELESVKKKTEELTGQKEMRYVRAPRGVFSERTLALSKELGYTNVFWSLAYVDWNINDQKGWQYAYDNIMKQIHPGAIILLHTVSKDNAEALGKVIDELKKQGYSFKSLDKIKKK